MFKSNYDLIKSNFDLIKPNFDLSKSKFGFVERYGFCQKKHMGVGNPVYGCWEVYGWGFGKKYMGVGTLTYVFLYPIIYYFGICCYGKL